MLRGVLLEDMARATESMSIDNLQSMFSIISVHSAGTGAGMENASTVLSEIVAFPTLIPSMSFHEVRGFAPLSSDECLRVHSEMLRASVFASRLGTSLRGVAQSARIMAGMKAKEEAS